MIRVSERVPKTKTVVVGIGASAGGLDALKDFFAAVPADSGLAFVIVQHLDPVHESRTAEILARSTTMKVVEAQDGMALRPGTVSTNPPGKILTIREGRLVLGKPTEGIHVESPIDTFLTSLGEEQGAAAIGIILSGSTGLDGPAGIRAIRNAGGVCMVQDPRTAQFPAMPAAAIDTGLADYVLPPALMPAALVEFVQHRQALAVHHEEPASETTSRDVDAILELLRTGTNNDYRHYRRTTVLRRIQRRMALRKIASTAEYLDLLGDDREELVRLAKDMLIGVTSFFRDPEVFEQLRAEMITPLVAAKGDEEPLRAWVAGCASGEEAYSIAMLLLEATDAARKHHRIQVFATDIDEQALITARAGLYPREIEEHVSAERLARFFTQQAQGYQIEKRVRDTVVFSRHNVLTDPPFSKLDLVSCRNLLIYLDAAMQQKVLAVFSFAVNVGGYLLLGKSESVGPMEDLFEPLSKQNRIYRLRRSSRRVRRILPLASAAPQLPLMLGRERAGIEAASLRQVNLEAILRHFDAGALLAEPTGEIRYFHGPTERYLGHPKGLATLNILDLAGGAASARLRRAMDKAQRQREPVRLQQMRLSGKDSPAADVTVVRAGASPDEGALLAVIFEEAQLPRPKKRRAAAASDDHELLLAQLEAEVRALREELRSNAEGYETANEELKSASEEVMSMNEELQSANEELDASREELQSINEELTTVNSQLNDKLEELTEANNDLANLLKATDIGTVFLDAQSRIRRFTPRATEMLNLIESDVGRPLAHMTQNFTGLDLAADADKVLKTLSPTEREVLAKDGRWYTVRVLPYRTLNDRIDGTVVTFSDVSRLKQIEDRLRHEKTYTQSIVETVHNPLVVLDHQLRLLSANAAFHRAFRIEPEAALGRKLHELGDGQWNVPSLRDALQATSDHGAGLDAFEVQQEFAGLGHRTMLLNARRIESPEDGARRILLAIEDITDRKAAETELRALAERLTRSNAELDQFARVISHDLQGPLHTITGFMELLQKRMQHGLDERSQEYVTLAMDSASRMQAMIKDLLDFSRLGYQRPEQASVDLGQVLSEARLRLRAVIEESGAKITAGPLPTVLGSSSQLTRVLQNLIANAIKFRREPTPEIRIESARGPDGWVISVQDNGIGIDGKFAGRVFEVFQRLHPQERYEGTGIGLAICKKIVEQHGGRIWFESEVGRGTTFRFTLPAA